MSVMLEILSQRRSEGIIQASNQEIIGIEIRRKRLELSCTLNGLCSEICSPSYLCKIERNQIQANSFILQEICDRVAITDTQQDLLFHSYEILLSAVKAYLHNDLESLEGIVKQGNGFENYRYKIIQLMKYILKDELYYAKKNYNELVKLLSSMQDLDMLVFSVFTAILEYKEKNYVESIAILNEIGGIPMDENLSVLYSKYLFLSSSMMLSGDTTFYYYDVIQKLKDLGYYSMLEEIHYALGIYGLKINSPYILDYVLKLLHEEVHTNSLRFLNAYLNKDMTNLEEYKSKPLNEFSMHLLSILEGNTGNMEIILHLTGASDSFDFSINLLKYLCYSSIEEKRKLILDTFDYYKKVKDVYVSNYFMKELLRINVEKPHNKETVTTLYNYYVKAEER